MSKVEWLAEDILAGCAEILYRLGRRVYMEDTEIGWIEDEVWPDDDVDKVASTDLAFGCCYDVILRPVFDDTYTVLFPTENWFAAELNKEFHWERGYQIKFKKDWQLIGTKLLASHNASFVLRRIK